ncbi:hypothetical protein LVD15_25625 [Fulvivirga maritima]|uniref:hypothetical protein n=1 Tax=Fulvivirga maritima TaxID=2904247 RepID=UPI001F38B259|nr:hypothetical protein [Fulvivirga maritima]UII26634.1 hypothetical protein LVD15_25625 [Fulvivirga maritima]
MNNIIRYSLVILLLMGAVFSFSFTEISDCDNFKVEVEVEKKSVEFKVSSTAGKISYFIYDKDSKPVSEGKSKIQNLSVGDYKYFIYSDKGCWKRGEFKIK